MRFSFNWQYAKGEVLRRIRSCDFSYILPYETFGKEIWERSRINVRSRND